MDSHRCIICNSEMKQTGTFFSQCPMCKFLISSLSPGAGAPIQGVGGVREKNFNCILKHCQTELKNLKNTKLLEIGAADGVFLDVARKYGIRDTTGVEPDQSLANIAKDKGHNILCGFFPQVMKGNEQRYDMIVFNDSFEHLPELKKVLQVCEKLLNKEGLLIVNAPDSDGVLYRLARLLFKFKIKIFLERLWQKGLSSPHISYFNSKNLKEFAEKNGNFTQVISAHLTTFCLKGLKARITSTIKEPLATLIYIPMIVLSLGFYFLPKDIMFQVFKKNN